MAKKKTGRKQRPTADQGKKVFSGNEAASAVARDGFRNFAMKLGVAAPGDDGCSEDNLISKGHYKFDLITRNRIQLEAAYRGSWIVGRVIDCVAEDMTCAGVIPNTNEGAEKLQKFEAAQSRLQIWESTSDAIKWGRLYGGCISVLQIEGQNLAKPLDIDSIEKGQFHGLAVYDRWQVVPDLASIIRSGPNLGLPAYYDIVIGSNLNDPRDVPGAQQSLSYGNPSTSSGGSPGSPITSRIRVHHSRLFRTGGHKLPFFQAITEMMWDESVLERLWDRLIEFDTATASTGGLIGRALLRTVGIEGFREILAAGGQAEENLISQFEYMRKFQSSEGLTLLDKNDEFATTAYSFAGLADVLIQFGQQVSGSAEIPLVRLFGQSPVGLNSTGDADIRNYYDAIKAKQEKHLRRPYELISKVLWRSEFGEDRPSDFTFDFTPLWQMSAKDKADITNIQTTAISQAHQEGLVSTAVAMKELKQASADTGVFTHITDEEIAEAENEEPPMPDEPITPEEKTESKEIVKQAGSKDASFWARVKKFFSRDYITKSGEKYIVHAESGKKLGEYPSKEQAEKRLREIEYFKHQGDEQISDARKAIQDFLAK